MEFLLVKFNCKNMEEAEMEGRGTTTTSPFVFRKAAAAPEQWQTFRHNKHVL